MQVGGSYLGMMCGGGVFLMLSAASGWPVAMLMMAVLIMALSLPLWRITEPTRTATIRMFRRWVMRWEEAGAHGLTAGIDAEFRHAVCAASSGTAVVGSWVEHVRIGRAVQRRQYCSGHSRNAGWRIADEIHLTRQSAVDGLWRPGIALLAVVMTLMMAPGHLLLQILQCLVIVQSISLCALVCLYATLMSLSSPLQAGVDFTLFQCTDAAIAILAGVIGGVVAQHFGYAACFLFAGHSVAGGVGCLYPAAFGKRTDDKRN